MDRSGSSLLLRRCLSSAALLFALAAALAPAAAQALSFSGPTNFAAHTNPSSVAIGDLNGDGVPDLVVANGGSNDISVLLGNGSGGFPAPTNFAAHTNPGSVAIGDFNHDSKPDLAVANEGSNDVSVLLGNGAGGFSAATNFAAGNHPFSIAIGDLNGDSKPDLVVANCGMGAGCGGSNGVSVLLGNGSGGLSAPTTLAAGTGVRSVAIGDLNGDGKPDLAVANGGTDNLSILLGNGDGTFSAPTNFAAGSVPESVAIGDLNGDGKPDLAVANCSSLCVGSGVGSGNVSILLGNGSGGFSAPTNVAAGSFPESVAIRDLNGDSKPDLAVANGGSNDVSILLGNGGGGFSGPINFAAHASPEEIAIGDLNRDSKPDLVVANQGSNDVSILLANGGGFNWGFAAAPTNFAAHTGPISIAIGQLNALTDANPDLAVANQGSGDVSVLTGNGSGGFSAPANFPVHTNPCCQPSSVAIGGFGGGSSDLAVANKLSGDISSLLGDGSGGFSAATGSPFAAHTSPSAVAIGDLNGDRIPDLAVANAGSSDVSVLLSNGSGGFLAATNFAAHTNPSSVAIGDLNGDGKLDLAVANSASNDVSILLGNGSGGFSAPTNFAAHTTPSSVAIGDFKGNGIQDLAVANVVSNDVSILLGNGDGTFSAPVNFAAHTNPASVAAGDLNGDGIPDLAVANKGSNDISILLGDGNGGFGAPVNFAAHTTPVSVAVGDLNGDSKPDIAVANNGSNDISILLNTTPPGYPRPKGATPLRASLVIAYAACSSPNSSHGAPLSYGSCNPPLQASPNLTVGTPDANGAGAKAIGSVLLLASINPAPTPSDLLIDASTTDVRCRPGEAACGTANTADGPDYTGELQVTMPLRLTDKFNGPSTAGGAESGTVEDARFPVTVPCTATSDSTVGSTCAISTSANAVLPSSVQTGNRAIWQLGQMQVFDGGASGTAGALDAKLFEDQGVFVP